MSFGLSLLFGPTAVLPAPTFGRSAHELAVDRETRPILPPPVYHLCLVDRELAGKRHLTAISECVTNLHNLASQQPGFNCHLKAVSAATRPVNMLPVARSTYRALFRNRQQDYGGRTNDNAGIHPLDLHQTFLEFRMFLRCAGVVP